LVHDVLKLIVVIASLAVIVGLVALFASNYISALRPGGVVDSSKNATGGGGGGGTRSVGGGLSKSLAHNATMPTMPAEQQEYGQEQQTIPEPQQISAPQQLNQQGGNKQQPVETGGTPTAEPTATVSPGAGNENRATPTAGPAIQPGMPDMSEYFSGWQAALEQFFRMLPYIFSQQFDFMPSWPTWPLNIKTIGNN
jgi:hypothetical protein